METNQRDRYIAEPKWQDHKNITLIGIGKDGAVKYIEISEVIVCARTNVPFHIILEATFCSAFGFWF